jgi:hypothetical protein
MPCRSAPPHGLGESRHYAGGVESSLVLLATGLSDFEAKVLTARLGAQGIVWQVRGVVDSVYPLGDIDVLVRADELDDAMMLLSPGAEPMWGPDEPWGSADRSGTHVSADSYRTRWWFGAALIGATTVFFLMRLLAFG